MELNILLIALLLFLFTYLLKWLTKITKPNSYSCIPGPKPLPLIGNLHLMLRAAAPHHLFRDLAAVHGPLMHLKLGQVDFVIVSSLDVTKQMMKTHDVNFSNRPPGMMSEMLGLNHNDVFFSPYGGYWRQLRKICTLELLSTKRVRSFRQVREEENMVLARSIASSHGSPVNLSEKIYLATYDVITRASVGSKTEDREAMISVIDQVSELASGFIMADLFPSSRLLPFITGAHFKLRQIRRKMDLLFDNIIEQHRARARSDDDNDNNNGGLEDLVDVLLKVQQDDTQQPLKTDNIKAVLLDMFLAGTDTSSTTIEWAMSEMIRNPSKLNKAQEEVRKVFDSKGYVDEEKFDELRYVKLVIKETLRLHPPVPLLLPRMNIERCELNGYEIPARSTMIVNAWALGRDPSYWNEADEFLPERFNEESSSIDFKGNNMEYIPFGAGRRMCPGMSLGLANVEFPLAMLLYHFDWEMPDGVKNDELDMTEAFGASVGRKHKLHLIPIVKRSLPVPAPSP